MALSVRAHVQHLPQLAVLLMIGFHCLLRIGELAALRWCDLRLLPASSRPRRDAVGVAVIRRPKTRRSAAHAAVQHVIIESEGIGTYLNLVFQTFENSHSEQYVAPWPAPRLRSWLSEGLSSLGLSPRSFSWSGLRAGGATEFWIRRQNLGALRRRGRWSNSKTLERYVQEGVVLQYSLNVPTPVQETLDRLCELAPLILESNEAGVWTKGVVDLVGRGPESPELLPSSSSSDNSE